MCGEHYVKTIRRTEARTCGVAQAQHWWYSAIGGLVVMTKHFQLSVALDGQRLIIDLPEGLVVAFDGVSKSTGARKAAAVSDQSNDGGRVKISEREFVSQKNPRGHGERVAVLAFCLRDSGILEFTADDMRRAYIRAGVKPPKVVAQALRDAKNKYDLIESGSKRSTFRLSPHGERTVLFDLPAADSRLDT
jgi:hypothetical protein